MGERIPEHIENMLFPLCFVFSHLVSAVLFYAGFGFEENAVRRYGFIVLNVLFAVLCGLVFLQLLREKGLAGRAWLRPAGAVLFFVVCGAIGFWRFGFQAGLVKYAERFIVFSVPTFLMGVCSARQNREASFFSTIERFSPLALPCALIYFNGVLFECLTWSERYLGVLRYMYLAYTFLPFLLAHIVCFVEKKPLSLLFFGGAVKRPQTIRAVFIGTYWLAIIASGTRGAYSCGIAFCALLVLSGLVHRDRAAKPAAAVLAVMAGVLAFLLFVYAPLGLDRAPQRLQKTSEDLTAQVTVPVRGDDENWEEEDQAILAELNEMGSFNRGTMYALALREFVHRPVFGMGPGGYTVKYGRYPHNVLLETLCETGAAGTAVLLLLLGWAGVRMLAAGKRRKEVRYILLFFAAYGVHACLSGSVWESYTLLGALGYGLALPLGYERKKGGEN